MYNKINSKAKICKLNTGIQTTIVFKKDKSIVRIGYWGQNTSLLTNPIFTKPYENLKRL